MKKYALAFALFALSPFSAQAAAYQNPQMVYKMLTAAAAEGNLYNVMFALDSLGVPVDTMVDGKTALEVAAENGHKAIVKLLLQRGASKRQEAVTAAQAAGLDERVEEEIVELLAHRPKAAGAQ